MSDDPTTKPCRIAEVHQGGHGYMPYAARCSKCHGTGRVPMSVEEMLEALASKHGVMLEYLYDRGWYANSYGFEAIDTTLADALRAALRAVSE